MTRPQLTPADNVLAAQIERTVGQGVLRPVTEAYVSEPRGRHRGQAGVLALPRTVDDVSAIIRHCADRQVGVIPFGGGTGLVSGQVMPDGPAPLILSLERMSALRNADPADNTLVAEAGVTLQSTQDAAEAVGRLFPLSIASQGTAQIGGVLATNAGGVNTLRYGNARNLCLGVEAVLPNGDIWHGLTPLRKDNLGYDLRDLLIGAEGTLGVITAASLRLFPRPDVQMTALIAVPDPAAALKLLALAQDRLGDTISAFELIHRQGFEFIGETLPDMHLPFDPAPEWTVLLDIGAPGILPMDTALETLIDEGSQTGLILTGWLAQSGAQRDHFWALREALPEANRRIGSISSHDVSVPLAAIPEFIAAGRPMIEAMGDMRINCFGHVGDGNLHYNVFPAMGRTREDYDPLREAVKHKVHDLVHRFGGSVAAEHGVGRLKTDDVDRYADATLLKAMRTVKAALDPKGIMNPGVILAP